MPDVYNLCVVYTLCTMRTNVEIDDALMNDALQSGSFASKREAVEAGLRLLAQRGRYRELLALRGRLEWEDSPTSSIAHSPYELQEERAAYDPGRTRGPLKRPSASRKSAK